jgi:hypothetical protein
MSALNLVLHPGHIYCRECLEQIPATFLFCPRCCGFVRDGNQWVALAPAPLRPPEGEEQPLLFDMSTQEYPA